MENLLFCERTFYPFFHHSTSFLCTGGLVSKACSSSSKTGCICTTPTRPYKSCNKHCPFSKSRKRFWLFSSSLSIPKNSKVCCVWDTCNLCNTKCLFRFCFDEKERRKNIYVLFNSSYFYYCGSSNIGVGIIKILRNIQNVMIEEWKFIFLLLI